MFNINNFTTWTFFIECDEKTIECEEDLQENGLIVGKDGSKNLETIDKQEYNRHVCRTDGKESNHKTF